MKIIKLYQHLSELIELAAASDRKAQHEIYNMFASKMLSVCRLYLKNLQQAEDVMLLAFMKVFGSIRNFENKGSFEGWIRRIMINECLSHLRVHKKMNFIEDENNLPETVFEINDSISVEEIQRVIDQLPDGYRMIFNLYAIEGYKHKEISQMLGISEGTSKSQLSHAKRILQGQINKLNAYQNGTQ